MKLSRIGRLKLAEVILLFSTMIMVLNLATSMSYTVSPEYTLAVVFLAIALSDVVRFLRLRSENTDEFVRYVILSILYFIAGISFFFAEGLLTMRMWMLFYSSTLIISRAFSMIIGIRNRSVKGVILHLLRMLIFVPLLLYSFVPGEEELQLGTFLMSLIMVAQLLLRLLSISMSQIRFDILKRIIVKSMAAEVMSGLIILIVTFSLVFATFEPSMKESYSHALWYCFAVVTTIGFGDYAAATAIGQILTVILGIYGIIVVALITSIIINFYSETKDVKMSDSDNDDPDSSEAFDGNSSPAPRLGRRMRRRDRAARLRSVERRRARISAALTAQPPDSPKPRRLRCTASVKKDPDAPKDDQQPQA
ncbi:MAG: two pore domain potassium channel family protein [Ruminococcus sp.]|nr:two pore domain potassium channel family protein [Ruminococcus sp.]